MKKFYKKYDDYFLTKYPILWVIGLHIFIPLSLLVALFLVLCGIPLVLNEVNEFSTIENVYNQVGLGMILPVILLVIIFIRRQIQFNSIRVHQKLPFKMRFTTFMLFWVTLFAITTLPFTIRLSAVTYPNLVWSKTQYQSDIKAINTGYVHFRFLVRQEYAAQEENGADEVIEPYYLTRYSLNEKTNQLILTRQFYRYYSNSEINVNDTISLDSANHEVENFTAVAQRYGAQFETTDASKIISANLLDVEGDYDLFRKDFNTEFERINSKESYNRLGKQSKFQKNIQWTTALHEHSGIFRFYSFEFWQNYSLIGFGISFLLIILCSVPRSEFGWAMLTVALIPTVYGVIYAILEVLDVNVGSRFLMLSFLAATSYVTFLGNFKSKLKRVFAISINIFLPIVVPILFELNRQESFYWSFVIVGLGATALYSVYYRIHYLNPQP